MYQNFDEKYVTINYDEGSSATLTQTTLAYWDLDYGKKVLTNDEQINMYLKPKVSPAIKYLMYDNMVKLVDANAFVKVEKQEDALSNIKYNFYTKRNVRYTILFPAQFKDINIKYLLDFEELYIRQDEILKVKNAKEIAISEKVLKKDNSQITPGVNAKVVNIVKKEEKEEKKIETFELKEDVHHGTNELKESVEVEQKVLNVLPTSILPVSKEITEKEESKTFTKIENKEEKKIEFKEPATSLRTTKKSKVIINEDENRKIVDRKNVNKENLSSILESLDLI